MNPKDTEEEWEKEDAVLEKVQAKLAQTQLSHPTPQRTSWRPPAPEQDGGSYLESKTTSPTDINEGIQTIDSVLLDCLDNARERLAVLKLEDQILRFIKTPRESTLCLPALTSYHRMLVHRIAQRCCLEHISTDQTDYNPQGNMAADSGLRNLTLGKTQRSTIPDILLIDIATERQQQKDQQTNKPKIMIRRNDGKKSQKQDQGAGQVARETKSAAQTIQDREKAYAAARARIFGTKSVEEQSEPREGSTPTLVANKNTSMSKQASGPDGTAGFTSGRGRTQQNTDAQLKPETFPGQRDPPAARSNPRMTENRSGLKCAGQDWSESKVTWRNREEEMNDPDFTRNYMYRPNFNAYRQPPPGPYAQPPLPPQYRFYSGVGRGVPPPPAHSMGYPSSGPYRDDQPNVSYQQGANSGYYHVRPQMYIDRSMSPRGYPPSQPNPREESRQPPSQSKSSYNADFPPLS